MGKTRPLIFNENPKKLVYLVRLHHFEEKSLYKRTKNFLKSQNKTDAYSISGWCKIVGDKDNDTDHDENPNTRKIIESFIEEDILVEEGMRGKPPNEVPVYSLDKDKLLDCYQESQLFQLTKQLNIDTINKKVRFRSVIRDINF